MTRVIERRRAGRKGCETWKMCSIKSIYFIYGSINIYCWKRTVRTKKNALFRRQSQFQNGLILSMQPYWKDKCTFQLLLRAPPEHVKRYILKRIVLCLSKSCSVMKKSPRTAAGHRVATHSILSLPRRRYIGINNRWGMFTHWQKCSVRTDTKRLRAAAGGTRCECHSGCSVCTWSSAAAVFQQNVLERSFRSWFIPHTNKIPAFCGAASRLTRSAGSLRVALSCATGWESSEGRKHAEGPAYLRRHAGRQRVSSAGCPVHRRPVGTPHGVHLLPKKTWLT